MKSVKQSISLLTTSLVLSLYFITEKKSAMAAKIVIPNTDLPGPSEVTQVSGLTEYFNSSVFGNLTQTIIGFAGIAALLFAIISGVRMLTAYGSDDTYGAAKKMFILSLVGLVIAMLSYTIVSIIGQLQF